MLPIFNKSRTKKSKKTVLRSPSVVTLAPTMYDNQFDCYYFLSPNDYPESALGILASLLLKYVSTKNFSDIMNKARQVKQLVTLLEEKRKLLSIHETSIEECLMLTRLISFIKEDEKYFENIVSHVIHEMEMKLISNQFNQEIDYIEAFNQRKIAQDKRRLFYFTHNEVNQPLNLLTLQDKVTQQLSTLIDSKIKNSSKARDYHMKTIENLLNNSFMITVQPQYHKIPVLMSKTLVNGIYQIKISVIIVSLLSDFMQTRPNIIEFKDIETELLPVSNYYKLHKVDKLFWRIYDLRIKSTETKRIFHVIKLSSMVIEQIDRYNIHTHFANIKHTLKFSINININLHKSKYTKNCTIVLETMPFAIATVQDHIPQLLSNILLDDIQRFSDWKFDKIELIWNFLRRYFIYRIGVEPYEDQRTYVLQELNRALNSRKSFVKLEDIYMDFLVPYVNQVEYMVKHPILSMLYADRLFLGICDSSKAAEIMKRSIDEDIPKIGLRFNSIRIDYKTVDRQSVFDRNVHFDKCAVRVDIYNDRKKIIKYRTFDQSMLDSDICKVIFKALLSNHNHIRILCNFNNDMNYQSFDKLTKYYHSRLHELSKCEEKYKYITDFDRSYRDQETDDSVFDDDDDDDDYHSDNSRFTDSSMQNSVDSELTLLVNPPIALSENFNSVIIDDNTTVKFSSAISGFFENTSISHNVSKSFFDFCGEEMLNDTPVYRSLIEDKDTLPYTLNIQLPTHQNIETSPIDFNDRLCVPIQAESATSDEQTPTGYYPGDHSNTMPYLIPSYDSTYPLIFEQSSKYRVIYLSENPQSTNTNIEVIKDKYLCISDILSSTEKLIYLIISTALAKIVIPLIHEHICLESIYIEGIKNPTENTTWNYSFSKIRGIWFSMKQIVHECEQDFLLLKYSFNHSYNNSYNIDQKSIISTSFVQDTLPYIIIITKDNAVSLDLLNIGVKIYEFNVIKDYHTFMKKEQISQIFLIIIDDFIIDIEELTSYDTIHKVYLYLTNNKPNLIHKKINRSFNREQDLRQQLMTDICFFRQLPVCTSKISLFKIDDKEKVTMFITQFYTIIFNQFCIDPNIPEEISKYIEKNNNNLSHDLYTNNIQLTLCMDELIQKFDFHMLLKAATLYGFINEYYESSMKKICPTSMTVYRVQLVSTDDLMKIQNNKNSLFTIPTLIFASRSYISSKTICRQVYQNNLTAILFEINIPERTTLTYINDDIIIFPLATVFSIKSIDIAPDNICHVRLQIDISTIELLMKQINGNMKGQITWLTFGNYLARIEQFDAAEKYFEYLLGLSSLDFRQRAAIYHNLGSMYLSIDGKHDKSLSCLKEAQLLLEENKSVESERKNNIVKQKQSDTVEEYQEYVKLAEQYEKENDYLYACFFYEKALELTDDSILRTNYQLKIQTLNTKF